MSKKHKPTKKTIRIKKFILYEFVNTINDLPEKET